MSERYQKLFALPENLYAVGSPVVIAAGALLKDTQTGKVLAQLKLRNIGKKTIKAATVSVEPLDTVGKPLGESVTYQYLDLHADRDADFGQKTPISLPDAATRSFSISVAQVIFTDNSIWNADNTEWKSLNRPVPLDLMEDSELAMQFLIEYGGGCENLLLEQKDLWHCVCGGVNHQEETNCHKCGKALVELQAIDMEDLRKKKEERVARKKAEAEAARKEAEIAAAKARKIGKLFAIAVASLVVIAIAANAIFGMVKDNNAYKDAQALMDAGQYEEAIAAFEAMDDYKDSADKIIECKYLSAVILVKSEQYEQAITAFKAISQYRDSAAQIKACRGAITDRDYNTAVELMHTGQYEEAIAVFQTVEGYKDSAVQIQHAEKAIAEMERIENEFVQKMSVSMLEASELCAKISNPKDDIRNLIDICNHYVPYMGTFALLFDGEITTADVTCTSDFYLRGNDIYWKCDGIDWMEVSTTTEYFVEEHLFLQQPLLVKDDSAIEKSENAIFLLETSFLDEKIQMAFRCGQILYEVSKDKITVDPDSYEDIDLYYDTWVKIEN